MSESAGRTPRFERMLHHVAMVLVTLTGVAYFVLKDLVEPDPESFSVVSHPWQPHAQHLHVLFAPLLVLSMGVLLKQHVLARLVNADWKRSRRTGASLVLFGLPMIATGYLLQVSVDETWRSAWKWSHIAASLLFVAGYAAHAVLAYRKR